MLRESSYVFLSFLLLLTSLDLDLAKNIVNIRLTILSGNFEVWARIAIASIVPVLVPHRPISLCRQKMCDPTDALTARRFFASCSNPPR